MNASINKLTHYEVLMAWIHLYDLFGLLEN
jgi:hypothetical protein